MNEFELIRRYFYHRQRSDVMLGPGDDAALLQPAAGQQLVMTMDTLLGGVHFPTDLPAHAIGFRTLATNLSDLAAMGATPCWCLASLTLPEVDESWLAAFSAGFFQLADQAGISLVGGDVVRGPLSISIQATGQLPMGAALKRSGAKVGDQIVLAGVPGEAAAGLESWQQGVRQGPQVERFCYPQPQLALGQSLRHCANSCIDVSDGVLVDLSHLLEQSGNLGAAIMLDQLPSFEVANRTVSREQMWHWQLSGGDDYLLLFTLPQEAALPKGCYSIGRVEAKKGLRLIDANGGVRPADIDGWKHF